MIFKKRINLLLIALSAIFLFTFGASAFADGPALTENTYDKIDAYLSEVVPKTHFPSLAITIVDGEKALFSKVYGNGSTEAPYVLGSVSKSFTALCVMQLVEQGKV